MLTTLATLAAVALVLPQQREGREPDEKDTTLAVQSGARLDVTNFGGEIVVRTWNQNNVRVRASHSSRSRVEVSSTPTAVLVRTAGRRGRPSIVDLELTVPTWMGMTLGGTYTDIVVEGAGGAVSAESVQGDIAVAGGDGNITLKSVEGDVTLTRARGRIQVTAVEGDVRVNDGAGEVTIETVDGDVMLQRIDASSVDVGTVDGDIVYVGTIKDGGSYRLSTHDGDITVAVAPSVNARVMVASFDGAFDASFPVDVQRAGKHRFNFTIGTGKARLELETFDGDVRLRRPGEVTVPERRNRNQNDNQYRDHDEGYDYDYDYDY